jgi:hypothetical protein
MSDAETFLSIFKSNPAAHYIGTPTNKWEESAHGLKREFLYRCVRGPFNVREVDDHLEGRRQIVANPLMPHPRVPDGLVYWSILDRDVYNVPFTPSAEYSAFLNFDKSKSGGDHAIAVFTQRQYATTAVRLMERHARAMGWWPCEINPKQTEITKETPIGNGVALPYFGAITLPTIVLYAVPIEEWFKDKEEAESPKRATQDSQDQDTDEGWWSPDALLAMLDFYRENFPGFEFKCCRRGYAVPCPGNPALGGWPDGAMHSTSNLLISHEALVFLKNSWPKFVCMHDHCGGWTDPNKKTINDWRSFWDPLRLWDFTEWQDAEMLRLERLWRVHGQPNA